MTYNVRETRLNSTHSFQKLGYALPWSVYQVLESRFLRLSSYFYVSFHSQHDRNAPYRTTLLFFSSSSNTDVSKVFTYDYLIHELLVIHWLPETTRLHSSRPLATFLQFRTPPLPTICCRSSITSSVRLLLGRRLVSSGSFHSCERYAFRCSFSASSIVSLTTQHRPITHDSPAYSTNIVL